MQRVGNGLQSGMAAGGSILRSTIYSTEPLQAPQDLVVDAMRRCRTSVQTTASKDASGNGSAATSPSTRSSRPRGSPAASAAARQYGCMAGFASTPVTWMSCGKVLVGLTRCPRVSYSPHREF